MSRVQDRQLGGDRERNSVVWSKSRRQIVEMWANSNFELKSIDKSLEYLVQLVRNFCYCMIRIWEV